MGIQIKVDKLIDHTLSYFDWFDDNCYKHRLMGIQIKVDKLIDHTLSYFDWFDDNCY